MCHTLVFRMRNPLFNAHGSEGWLLVDYLTTITHILLFKIVEACGAGLVHSTAG